MATLRDIVKLQTQGLERLDVETLRKLEPILIKLQENLRNELDRYSEDSFTYKHRMQTLMLVTRTLKWMEDVSIREMETAANKYNTFAADVVKKEMDSFAIIPTTFSVEEVAIEKNQYLIERSKASLQRYTADMREMMRNAITQGLMMRKSGFEIVGRLSKFMNAKIVGKKRLQRIVRTEMHRIFNESKNLSYYQFQEDIPGLKKGLLHPMDHRTGEDSKMLNEIGPVVALHEPFEFTYKRVLKNGEIRIDKRVFFTPPDRANDRATIVPVIEE